MIWLIFVSWLVELTNFLDDLSGSSFRVTYSLGVGWSVSILWQGDEVNLKE